MKNYLFTLLALSFVLAGCNGSKQAKTVTLGPNPFITHMYTADPSAHVWEDGRLYVYASHDVDPPRGCDLMDRYHVFSTDDMVNWTDHGEILNSSQVSWGRKEGGFMWAPDCAYKDGTYYGTGTGFAGNLKVEVVISGGKISNIQIVETNDGSEYIQKASGVINQILGAQSTNGIDTVSGATFSSNGIIKAVRNALSQAAATETAAADNGGNSGSDGTNTVNKENTENNTTAVTGTLPYNDGVYYGTAEGYNGDITVAIVIQEKTLKAVLVIGEEDDDAFFGRAMDVVTQMMKKQSTEVDTVSGATYSSKGLIQAVKNALEEAKRVTNGETDTADDNNGVQLNTGEVEKVIDAVNELNGSDYTSASWAVVKVRLKDARKALKNATEQAQLDEAAAQLNQAIAELRISDGTNEDPEPDLPPESTYIDGVYPVTVLCLPDADMDFEAYNLFAQVTIQDDKIIKIDNVYGDGGSGNDSYINKAVNGTSSKTGVVKQITEKGNLDGIDTVSRATCTSQAIIDACQQAFNNAKRQ